VGLNCMYFGIYPSCIFRRESPTFERNLDTL
jgi:hypothetical protein